MSGAAGAAPRPVKVELSAVILGLGAPGGHVAPMVLTPQGPEGCDLPTAAFDPERHRTLQTALRDWVTQRTGLELGYVEQLYTFGDPIRSGEARPGADPGAGHTVSIGYLALTVPEAVQGPDWTRWDLWFPWEDRRRGVPPLLPGAILPALDAWAAAAPGPGAALPGAARRERVDLLFGRAGHPWRDELLLERYELLYEAGLVPEAHRDRGRPPPAALPPLGRPLPRDHRRILATGIGRLRAKIKYRPVLFELVGERFTLLELQRAAEAVAGVALHKQNFRRMVERSGLIEPTGQLTRRHGGRPAAEHRFTPEAMWERRAAAVRFGGARRTGG